jgi:diguanylate cyclase (GGDEF)-like protein
MLSASPDPERMRGALETLRRAFECDGVAIHAVGPSGIVEPWCALGEWRVKPGDLRDCMTVPLLRGSERLGTLDLLARPGQRWGPQQLGLVRTASGALGAALGARLELERLRRQPGRDAATGLPDERAFVARVEEELARARGIGLSMGVALVEIDHFAALTARYGPEVADEVLGEAALVIKLALREGDLVARLAGARFALLLPETDGNASLRCAERVRRAIEDHRFGRVTRVSASAGAAACPRDGLETVELMDRVTKALSLARKSGRRRAAAPAHGHVQ